MTAARLMAACLAPTETAPSSMAFRSLESPAGRGSARDSGQRPGADAGGRQPGQAGTHDVRADREDQPDGQLVHPVAGVNAAGVHPAGAVLLPPGPGVLGAAGVPPLLPGAAGKPGKPVQRQTRAAGLHVAGARVREGERRPGDQLQGRLMREMSGRRVGGIRTGREAGARGVPCRLPCLTPQPHRRGHLALQFLVQPDGHDAPVPNSTPSLSGR